MHDKIKHDFLNEWNNLVTGIRTRSEILEDGAQMLLIL